MVTLPLKRHEHPRSDVHPSIFLQQLRNRAERRLARMTGRSQPSDEVLRARLEKRVLALNKGELTRCQTLSKRFNRSGLLRTSFSTSNTTSAISLRRKKGNKGQGEQGNAASNSGNTSSGNGVDSGNNSSSSSQSDVTDSTTPQTANSLALDIEGQDISYLATVQLGTPPRDFLILMDSGSADFWVGSEQCSTVASSSGGQNQQGCGNHNFLGTQSSSTFQDTQKQFSVQYGTGSVSGDIITDNVVLAGLALNDHTFGVATQESIDFSSNDVPFDGLMGLAQSTLSEQQTLTPVESLAKQGLISEAITSFKIPRLADNKLDGEITFGGLDTSKFDPNSLVTFDNVNTQGFWEGDLDDITVNGQSANLNGRTAILDTGTTLIIAPANDAAAVHNLIPGSANDPQNGFTIPCSGNTTIALSFGGQAFNIDPRDMVVQEVDNNGNCLSGIQSGDIGGADEWLVGDVFLKNAYFSTNVNKNQISLANLV